MLPIKLELENFMSYDKAELDFNFTSALIVGETNGNDRVSNGSGKSTIFNAVEWALFGESRNKTADNVVRRGQPMCKVCFVFSHDDRTYRVIRTRNVKNSKMEVQFDELCDDGSMNELTHDTNKQTDAEIRRVIRSTHEVFINSSYFRQNSFFEFVQGTFSTRQAIIGSLLNLEKWNKYQERAKEELKILADKIDKAKAEVDQLPAKASRLEAAQTEAATAEAAKTALMLEESALLDEIRALELKATENKDSEANYRRFHEIKDRVATNKVQVIAAKRNIEAKEQIVARIASSIEDAKTQIESLGVELNDAEAKLASCSRPDISKIESALVIGRGELKLLTQQLETLVSDVCMMCGHEWTNASEKQAFIAERETKRKETEEKLSRAEPKLQALKKELEAARALELAIEKQKITRSKLESNREISELKHKAALEELDTAKAQLVSLEKKATELEELLAGIEAVEKTDFSRIESVLSLKRQQHQTARKKLADNNYLLGSLAQETKTLQDEVSRLFAIKTEMLKLSREAAIYGQLTKAFSRDGIQAIILDNVVEELSQAGNHWLGQLWTEPVYVNFITQKKNTKGDWRETFDLEFHTPTGIGQFEDFSGGEQFRISFAIRLALSMVQAKRMGGEIQLLMLDEVSTSLDPSGLEAFISIIRRLEKDMRILVISHDDKLKEEFEHIITVHKSAEGSTLTQS